VFSPPAPGAGGDWGTLPFPSDLFLNSDGRLALGKLPSGPDADPVALEQMREALLTVDGAGVWSPAFFPVTGAIDPATLAGNVVIVDLDNGLSPIAADLAYRDDLDLIIAAPKYGAGYVERGRYAAYLTNGVKGTDGKPLRAALAFLAARELATTPSDPGTLAAQTSLRPLLEALDTDTRGSLVAATVFRVQSVTATMDKMRRIVGATPPALDTNASIEIYGPDTDELDYIFGVQSPDALAGHDHLVGRPQPHGSVGAVIHATALLPSFLSTQFATDGILEFDGAGEPLVKSNQPVRFTLVLPKPSLTGGGYANLPAVFFIHGINRTRADMLAIAEPATKLGFAVVAIDLLHHGYRSTSAVDRKNDTTRESPSAACGLPPAACTPMPGVCSCPDGFADQVELTPATRFFHLLASGGIGAYHPLPMRENFRQSAIDLSSMAAFLGRGSFPEIAAVLGGAGLPTDLSFRAGELGIVTESFGSMMALVLLALDAAFDIGFIASPAATFPYPTLIHSANYSGQFTQVILGPHDAQQRTILGDPRYGARFEPVAELWNIIMQTGDPVAYGRAMLDGSLREDDGANIILAEAWSDEWVPNDAVEHLIGRLGVPVLDLQRSQEPPGNLFRYVPDLPVMAGPIKANIGGKRTAVHTLWHPAAHALVRKIADETTFEPGFPPFVRRPAGIRFDSPIAQVQAMWGQFFTDFYNGDAAPAARDPFAN
jgi:hypothetical protein